MKNEIQWYDIDHGEIYGVHVGLEKSYGTYGCDVIFGFPTYEMKLESAKKVVLHQLKTQLRTILNQLESLEETTCEKPLTENADTLNVEQ